MEFDIEEDIFNEIKAFITECVVAGAENIYLPLKQLQLVGARFNPPAILLSGDTLTLTYASGQKVKLIEYNE